MFKWLRPHFELQGEIMMPPQPPLEVHIALVPAPDAPSITCPQCGRTSYHPEDIKQGYCGACHDWTSPSQYGKLRLVRPDEDL